MQHGQGSNTQKHDHPKLWLRGCRSVRHSLSGISLAALLIAAAIGMASPADAETETPDEANTIVVLAIDYPPLIGEKLANFGPIYELMDTYAKLHFDTMIHPRFIPPARAQKVVHDGDWCLTTYPPISKKVEAVFVPLMEGNIRLGLLRERKPKISGPFTWDSLDDLRGKSITILRSNIKTDFHKRLQDAGIDVVEVESMQQGIDLLLKHRVDYTQADNISYLSFPADIRDKLELSVSSLFETRVGFYFNRVCQDRLFKAGHIPPEHTPQSDILTR